MRSSTTFTLSATKYTHMAVGLAGFGNDAVYLYKESAYLIPTDRFIGPLYTLLTCENSVVYW